MLHCTNSKWVYTQILNFIYTSKMPGFKDYYLAHKYKGCKTYLLHFCAGWGREQTIKIKTMR